VSELILRFLIGGTVVSLFAVLGDVFRPKSFAGLFDSAPSVALATLGLTVVKDGEGYAGSEATSMIAGALALLVYCHVTMRLLMRGKASSLGASVAALPVWFVVAFALWAAFLR
jgi:uncharacterized membrane protein (GlpM family)